jgi:hypothetical protein
VWSHLDTPANHVGQKPSRRVSTALKEEFLKRGKREGQRWVCLDIETVTKALRSTEIWQIGIVDYDTGKVLVDAYLEHFCLSYSRSRAVVHQFLDTGPGALGKMFKEKRINHCSVLVWAKAYSRHEVYSSISCESWS